MADPVEVAPGKWRVRARTGDLYVPLCYYPQGSLEDWHNEIVWRGGTHETRRAAWKEGLRYLDHDDFNIAVMRKGRCVGWLWNDELVDDDPAFLDSVTAKILAS